MTIATPLIPGLDEIVRQGDPKRLAEVTRGITDLFMQGHANFQPRHVDLFDRLLTGIAPRTEVLARADLAEDGTRREPGPLLRDSVGRHVTQLPDLLRREIERGLAHTRIQSLDESRRPGQAGLPRRSTFRREI